MKSLIVANWKLNPQTLIEAKKLFNSVKKGIRNIKKVEIVICPPFLYISDLKKLADQKLTPNLKFGAQDCFWENKGAFTGEISPSMLKNLGCQYVILGHSERRRYFQESDEMINKKIKAAISENLKPILCIGETEDERKEGKTFKVLKNQLQKNLAKIEKSKLKIGSLIVAYEPVWAIGTGNPCEPKEAKKVFLFLKKILKNSIILYGGSVNSENAINYLKESGFQGLLVGGASLKAKEFIEIVKKSEEV